MTIGSGCVYTYVSTVQLPSLYALIIENHYDKTYINSLTVCVSVHCVSVCVHTCLYVWWVSCVSVCVCVSVYMQVHVCADSLSMCMSPLSSFHM